MAYSGVRELIIENRHTGERLAMRRVTRGDDVWLELKGSVPPHRQGPPLHLHVAEDEEGVVRSGTLSAALAVAQVLLISTTLTIAAVCVRELSHP